MTLFLLFVKHSVFYQVGYNVSLLTTNSPFIFMSKLNIIAISGSLRERSYNTALLREATNMISDRADIEILNIGDLALFSEDTESPLPQNVLEMKQKIAKADAIIISVAEYNRSLSGALKNAIDWATRPYGDNSFLGKNVAVLGATPATTGTMSAQMHLKYILVYLGAHPFGQPEFYLAEAHKKFDENGKLVDEDTKKHLEAFLEKFLGSL